MRRLYILSRSVVNLSSQVRVLLLIERTILLFIGIIFLGVGI